MGRSGRYSEQTLKDSFEQLFKQREYIECSTSVYLVVCVLFRVPQPSPSPGHFQSRTMHDLTFQASSGRDPLF